MIAAGYRYDPARVLPLRRALSALRPLFNPDSILVDIGSGKGRVLLVASEFGFRSVRGVEFAKELCEAARANIARYKARTGARTDFQVIEADATERDVPSDEDVFVICNPFDGVTLQRVMANISRSLASAPRRALIIYYNPRWGDVVERGGDFVWLRDMRFWSFRFAVYSNYPEPPPG